MNIYQRIVLLLGAVIMVLILLLTPRVIYNQGVAIRADKSPWELSLRAKFINWQTVGTASIVVLSVTGLLWFALKDRE
jgi:hypothetical protein